MRVAPRSKVCVDAAGNHNNLMSLIQVPSDALHCFGTQDSWQVVSSEVPASRLDCRSWYAAVPQANQGVANKSSRDDPKLVPENQWR